MNSTYIVIREYSSYSHGHCVKVREVSDFLTDHESALKLAMNRAKLDIESKFYICRTRTMVEAKVDPVITEVFDNG